MLKYIPFYQSESLWKTYIPGLLSKQNKNKKLLDDKILKIQFSHEGTIPPISFTFIFYSTPTKS